MEASRFFVANLPLNTQESDLNKVFKNYGEITKIELKTKENLLNSEDVKTIAFVTLKINPNDAEYSLKDLNWEKINGTQLKVSLAKESFLDRLKREREETEALKSSKSHPVVSEKASLLLSNHLENTRKTFGDDEIDNDDDIAPELLITKKRAATSLHNGKIVIQSYDVAPIHVIESKKSIKQLDKKSSEADQKRKESLNKKKTQYQQKKSAIQQSLAGLDARSATKIKFDDSEDEETENTNKEFSKSNVNILGSDDETEDPLQSQLILKPEHFGKKGEKLLKMQSKQSLDPRFKIDAKFVDEEDEDEGHDNWETLHSNQIESQKLSEIDDERDWQMGILEQVVGTKLDTTTATQKAAKNKKMLRFDPSKDEHQKFLRSQETNELNKLGIKKQKKRSDNMNGKEKSENEEECDIQTPADVSKDVFYVVSDSLTQSLKTRGDGFSLLNMFGNTSETDKRKDQLKKVANEKILINKLDKNPINPFSYDSGSESDNETQAVKKSEVGKAEKKVMATKSGKQNQKVKIFMENFFISKNDIRLKEGAQFFKYVKSTDVPEENYEEVRNRLKLLIKSKIKKTKKNLTIGNYKGKHRR